MCSKDGCRSKLLLVHLRERKNIYEPIGEDLTMSSSWVRTLALAAIAFGRPAAAQPVQIESPHQSVILGMSFSPDNRRLALAGGDKSVSIHDWPSGKLRLRLLGHGTRVWTPAFSPDGRWLASCTGEWDTPQTGGEIRIWDLETGKAKRSFDAQPSLVFAVHFSPDGKLLLSGDWNGTVKVWDLVKGEVKMALEAHAKAVRRILYTPDRRSVVTAGFDGAIHFWDAGSFKLLKTLKGPEEGVTCVAISPDGAYLAASGNPWARPVPNAPSEIMFWDLAGGRPPVKFGGAKHPILALDFSSDGRMLATGGGWLKTGELKVFEVASGKVRAEFVQPKDWVEAVKFAPDGNRLISVGGMERRAPGEARVWSLLDAPRRAKGKPLSAQEQQGLWSALASADAAQAYTAIATLADCPSAVELLQAHVKPVASADNKQVARLIADLESQQFAIRERASRELAELADRIAPTLRKALKAAPGLETRVRLEQLLSSVEFPLPASELLRQVRAVEVLESIGSDAATSLMRKLASGAPESRLTREAKAAVDRLTNNRSRR